eukprot:1949549-Pyramimonas_sp.AAC.1
MSLGKGWSKGGGKCAGKGAGQQTYTGSWYDQTCNAKWKCSCGCAKNQADWSWCKHCGTTRSTGEVFAPRDSPFGSQLAQGVLPPPGLPFAPRPVGAQWTGGCGGGQDLKSLADSELQSMEQLGSKTNHVQLTRACQQERMRRAQPGRAAHDVAGEAHA